MSERQLIYPSILPTRMPGQMPGILDGILATPGFNIHALECI